ncbi:MAG: nucleoid-associated protein NdpA [Gammaproteobacteria bacterium CG22_combo_CG10-13_8_21_14_all_40_8]|nr:MAG: nucleoid-associated protein NdpA [Gammaproteobacteria bacterium CG22_combo_CG10-13_8_21_14_all_40_8]
MSLKHCIIHKIERLQPAADVVVTLADGELDVQGSIFSLYEQLRVRYMRSAQKRYGHFDPEQSANPLPGLIKDHLSEKSTFVSLTKGIMAQMKSSYEKVDEPFSAHVLIAMTEVNLRPELYIFWVNHEEVMQISSDLKVSNTRYINTSKIQFVAKVKLDDFADNETQRYLSVYTNRGNKDLTQAFLHFCGFVAGVDMAKETAEFLQIVDQFSEEIPPETVLTYKDKLLEYCVEQDKVGMPVVLDELSQLINEDEPEHFSRFVSQQQTEPQAEFYTDRSCLKKYLRYYGRDKNLSISFSSNMFGHQIHYNNDADILTIKQIPKSLKAQIKKNNER